jgi:transmembrane sensor
MKHSERIGRLMFRYIRKELSRKEKAELAAWRNLSPENDLFFREKTEPENIRQHFKRIYESGDQALEQLQNEFPDLFSKRPKTKIIRMNRLLRFAAAVTITIGLYTIFTLNPSIKAGGYQAMVVSPDGVKDDLNSFWRNFKRGFNDGYAGVIRKTVNGQLIYEAPNEVKKAKDKYYTLFTKRGGEYGLQLADGTMIWVNSATTIQYPANISQDTIQIAIDGEAYFEIPDSVKHLYMVNTGFNAQRPTLNAERETSTINDLRSPDDAMQITMRAGRFNVKSYVEEPAVNISFINGTASVRLDTAMQSSLLSVAAGQQVKSESGKLNIIPMADAGDVIAWTKNQISFHNANIKTIMREVSRWYDVGVIYEGTIPDKKYSIILSRDANIHDLLGELEKKGVHFSIHRKTITVSY